MKTYAEITQLLSDMDSKEQVDGLIQELCTEFGLDNYLYYRLVSVVPSMPGAVVLNGYPQEWFERYRLRKYITIDPVAAYCFNHTIPLLWQDLRLSNAEDDKAGKFMAESRDFGLKVGATIPFHGAFGNISALSITSTEEQPRSLPQIMQALPFLQALIPYIHEAINRIEVFPDINPFIIELSDREKECLLWAAEGKTSWETATIIGISERTVIFHLQNAVKKLKCANRTQAVARALSLRLILPLL